MSLVLRAVDVNLNFDLAGILDEVREVQYEAYRAWQDDILNQIDAMWRGWVEETGRSRRAFSLAFDSNDGRILVLNNARSPYGKRNLYAQYVHRAGAPKSDLYIDRVMAELVRGPIAEMMEYIELTVAEAYE